MRDLARAMKMAMGLVLLVGCTSTNLQNDLGGNGGAAGNGAGGNGAGGSGGSMGAADLAVAAADLADVTPPASDLASALPATDAAMSASCTAPTGCTAASAPICCVMTSVSSTMGSGGATCVASCPGSITGTGTSATESGRLHQVRRHLKHLSHPIVGDVNYGKGDVNRHYRARYGLYRLALHAHLVAFAHPTTGARLVVRAPLPADFAAVLAALALPVAVDTCDDGAAP